MYIFGLFLSESSHSWHTCRSLYFRYQVITSHWSCIAFKSPVTYIEKYFNISASFVELSASFSACPPSQRYPRRRSIAGRKDFRGFQSGCCCCCIAGKIFPCQVVHAADLVSMVPRMSHVRFMPLRTWREFHRIPAYRDSSLWMHAA